MKKELNDLLTVGNETKYLRINSMFRVESVPVDKYGGAVEIYNTEPDHMVLTLQGNPLYIDPHFRYLPSNKLSSKTADDLWEEIASAMEEIMDYNKNEMLKAFRNGYLC